MTKTEVMRHLPQQLSRARLIDRYVRDYLRETSVSQMAFAAEVREIYESTLPEAQRGVEFSQRSDLFERAKRDAEKLTRLLDGSVCRLPVEIEDAIVLALPDDRRDILEAELAARRARVSLKIRREPLPGISREAMLAEVSEAIAAYAGGDPKAQIREYREAAAALSAVANEIENGSNT